MSTEMQLPMSAEDEFAATLEALKPADKPEAAPQEAPQTRQDEPPRDEAGRFAPREEGAPAQAQEESEPFEGFSSLDPALQERFRGMLSRQEQLLKERNSFRDRFARANGDLTLLRRSQSGAPDPRRSTGGAPQARPAQGSAHQGQPGIAQARADVAAMPHGAERAEATRQLDAWEKHAQQYPEDAAAISQLVNGLRAEILGTVGPQLEELNTLRSQIGELRTVAEQFQHERQQARNQENQSVMDELAPGWRVLAGWQDEQGNDVPREARQWHPAMLAWLNGHDPEIRDFKLGQLSHGSPYVAAEVFRSFMADYEAVAGQQQTNADPVAQRRAESLRDVVPTGRSGGQPAWRAPRTPEDELEAAGRFLDSRRKRS